MLRLPGPFILHLTVWQMRSMVSIFRLGLVVGVASFLMAGGYSVVATVVDLPVPFGEAFQFFFGLSVFLIGAWCGIGLVAEEIREMFRRKSAALSACEYRFKKYDFEVVWEPASPWFAFWDIGVGTWVVTRRRGGEVVDRIHVGTAFSSFDRTDLIYGGVCVLVWILAVDVAGWFR